MSSVFLCACKNISNKEEPILEDFPWEQTINYIKTDISNQLNCDCIDIIYNESLLNEQRMLLLLGGFGSYYIQKDSTFNFSEKQFYFVTPPEKTFEKNYKNNCKKVEMTKITVSTDETIFFTELKVKETDELYVFLALKDKRKGWIYEVTGALN
jgi:hypothetical protein